MCFFLSFPPAVGHVLFSPAVGCVLFLWLASTIHFLPTFDPRLHLVVHLEPHNLLRNMQQKITLEIHRMSASSPCRWTRIGTHVLLRPYTCQALCRTRSSHLTQDHQKMTCGRLDRRTSPMQPFTAKTPLVPKQVLLPQGTDPSLTQSLESSMIQTRQCCHTRDQSHRIARNRVLLPTLSPEKADMISNAFESTLQKLVQMMGACKLTLLIRSFSAKSGESSIPPSSTVPFDLRGTLPT